MTAPDRTGPDVTPTGADDQACGDRNCLLASVLLVDKRGWLLLQERDEHAEVSPNQWGLVGGHLEAGESWEEALHRELEEETGLRVAGAMELWFDEVVQHSPKVSAHLADRWRIWAAQVDVTDDDITLGEGRQIVFVDPARVTDLDLARSASYALPRFLDSEVYKAMT